jgi:hypothetical protein
MSQGGTVVTRCGGTTDVSLVAATPSAGYTAAVTSKGPKSVEVKFASAGHTSDVVVTCSRGESHYQVDEQDR